MSLRKFLRVFVFCLISAAACQVAWADAIRLKNGRVIQGQVMREDPTQVAIVVNGSMEGYPKSDIEQLTYSHRHLALPASGSVSFKPAPETSVDLSLVEQVQKRLQAFNRFTDGLGRVIQFLRYHKDEEALSESQEAAREALPLARDRFSPMSALADILILLGFRAPALWLALFLVKEPRQFTRVAEFLIPAYGLIMLLMAYAATTAPFVVSAIMFPTALVAILFLFAWMFALSPGRALLAFLIAISSNILIEYLLTQAHLL